MASFYAELWLEGYKFPLRTCSYGLSQATDYRGRVISKVRTSLIDCLLDVPEPPILTDWATDPTKQLPGKIVFFAAQGGAALETVAWAAAWCVGYREDFISGDRNQGAYVCRIRIAAPVIQMLAGGPGGYAAPAAGEPAGPPLALVANPFAVALAAATATAVEEVAQEVIEEFVVPTFEQIVAAGLKALWESIVAGATAATPPVALTLALILASSTPAGGPGIPQPHGLPVDPNVLRLNTLAARHAAGTLTADEEEELVALLGKVKGIHIKQLKDLETIGTDFVGKVPMEASDLGRMALKHRIENGIWHNGNIAVFEYEDSQGKLQYHIQSTLSTTKRHAERLALEKLAADKIPNANVKRIYSELEPCEVESGGIHAEGCKVMLNSFFPSAKVTYSYDYAGRFADTRPGRTASLEKRAADFEKYKNLKP